MLNPGISKWPRHPKFRRWATSPRMNLLGQQTATSLQLKPNKLMPPLLKKKNTASFPHPACPPAPLAPAPLAVRRLCRLRRSRPCPLARSRLPSLSLSTSLFGRAGTEVWPGAAISTYGGAAAAVRSSRANSHGGAVVAVSQHSAARGCLRRGLLPAVLA